MSSQDSTARDTRARGGTPVIERLLFVSDAAVADDVDRFRHFADVRLDTVLSH